MRLRAVSLLGCFYGWLRAVNGACSALNKPVRVPQLRTGRLVVQESNNRFVLCGCAGGLVWMELLYRLGDI